MKSEYVGDLVQRDESQTLERKQSLACQHEGLEALCGMVNADPAHATVVFSVSADGKAVGVEPGDLDKA